MSTHTPPQDSTDAADHHLLLRFSRDGEETAFREIVDRYAGLVRAVARRTTGDAGLAEETAQTVFATLARKATSVARTGHLGGWLHRTTVFHALRRLRTEARHRRKIAAFATAMPDATPDATHDLPPAWHDALPLLDASLQRLRESERRVLILRYFEDHSYPAIAAATGKSEDAVKKQTARALDRLRGLMQARGVAVTTTALATGMAAQSSAHAAVSAPALATAALKAASSLTWPALTLHSLHLMNISKPAAAVVILLCAAPIAWQERAIATARREVTALENIHALPPAVIVPPPAVIAPPSAVVVMDIEQFAKDVQSAYGSSLLTPAAVAAAAKKRLDALDGPALAGLLKDVHSFADEPAQHDDLELRIFHMLEKRAPLLALRAVPALLKKDNSLHSLHFQYQGVASSCLMALLKQDPDTALKEYRSLCESGLLEGKGVDSLSYVLHGQFAGQLLDVRLAEGKALYATLNDGGKSNALLTASRSQSAEARAFVLAEAAKLEPRDRSSILSTVLEAEAMRNGLDAAAVLFKQLPMEPGQTAEIAARFIKKVRSVQSTPLPEGLDWLRAQLPPEQFAEAGGLLIGRENKFPTGHVQENRNKAFRATEWGPHRDQAVAAFFKQGSLPDDAGEALSLAVEIRDPNLRMETLRLVTGRFKGQPQEWKNAIESSTTLTPEEKTGIFQP